MWLDRIKQKLESGEYQTVGEFVSDFQLIFRNCSTFNRVRFTETCYIINKSPNNRSIACSNEVVLQSYTWTHTLHLIFDRLFVFYLFISLKDNEFGRMGARLKQMFEEEFQKIFSIQ